MGHGEQVLLLNRNLHFFLEIIYLTNKYWHMMTTIHIESNVNYLFFDMLSKNTHWFDDIINRFTLLVFRFVFISDRILLQLKLCPSLLLTSEWKGVKLRLKSVARYFWWRSTIFAYFCISIWLEILQCRKYTLSHWIRFAWHLTIKIYRIQLTNRLNFFFF